MTHSFPTRLSSDLPRLPKQPRDLGQAPGSPPAPLSGRARPSSVSLRRRRGHAPPPTAPPRPSGAGRRHPRPRPPPPRSARPRSEEHTSELQSLLRISYAVFCLKKKKTKSED